MFFRVKIPCNDLDFMYEVTELESFFFKHSNRTPASYDSKSRGSRVQSDMLENPYCSKSALTTVNVEKYRKHKTCFQWEIQQELLKAKCNAKLKDGWYNIKATQRTSPPRWKKSTEQKNLNFLKVLRRVQFTMATPYLECPWLHEKAWAWQVLLCSKFWKISRQGICKFNSNILQKKTE